MQKKHKLFIPILALLCLVLPSSHRATAAAAKKTTLTGFLTYRERITLFPDAVAHVLLVDLGNNSADFIISQQTIKPQGQVPIPFTLNYNQAAIKPGGNYGIHAIIQDKQGKICWHTPKAVPVRISNGSGKVEVLLYQATDAITQTYLTDGFRFRAVFKPHQVVLTLPGGKNLSLRQVPAASGSKYSDGTVVFWSKGADATVEIKGFSVKAQEQKIPAGFGRSKTYLTEGLPFNASFEDELAWLMLPNQELIALRQVPSASGAKYSNRQLIFWSKGTGAILEAYGITLQARQVPAGPWEEAKKRGIEFRAVGQEPGWVLELKGDKLDLVTDYGQTRICAQLDEAEVDPKTGTKSYHALTDALTLKINIQNKLHYDSMSGEPFPATVTIQINGRQYQGGGRWL